jgi:death-on-curing family protein
MSTSRKKQAWYPEAKDVLDLHFALVELFATGPDPIAPAGQRDLGLLESACTRPRTSLGGIEKYKTVEEKGAALCHSLIKNHPFHNGNKRTGLVTLITFLWRNDRRFAVSVTDDEMFEMVLNVSRGTFVDSRDPDVIARELAQWLRARTVAVNRKPRAMTINDFLERCSRLGVMSKESGPSYIVYTRDHSIKISRSTKRLDPPVVRQFMNKLGLRDVTVPEFQAGVDEEQAELRRFRGVLRRLAHV